MVNDVVCLLVSGDESSIMGDRPNLLLQILRLASDVAITFEETVLAMRDAERTH